MPDNPLSRRQFVSVAGTAGAAMLAGCDGDGESNELELVHWWTAGGEEDAIQALIDGYEEEYDYTVNNNPAPGGAGSALDTVIQNRVLNENPPGTFQIWPGKAMNTYLDADVLADIGSVWTDEMQSAYQDGVMELAQTDDGTFVAVPVNIHRLNNLFYNVSVVEEAGVDPAGLETPSDVLTAMETVEAETDAAGMAHQTSAQWSTVQLWEDVLVGQTGVDTYLDVLDGNVGANEQAVKDALQTTADYREYFIEDAGSVSWDTGNQSVIQDEAAFLHQGDWAAGQYKSAEDFEYGTDWDYVPFPGTGEIYHVVSDAFVMPQPNPSPDATEAWLSYAGSVEGQIAFNTNKGSIPPRTDVSMDEFGPFLTSQSEDFGESSAQPPTIAHGTGVTPTVKGAVEDAFADFIANWNVDDTYSGIESAFN